MIFKKAIFREFCKVIPILFQNYSIAILIILFGFSDFSYVPIHIAIVYSVVSLTCFSMSANARSVFAAHNNRFREMLTKRILLGIPVFIICVAISSHLSNFSRLLVIAITIRKILDWIDEIYIQEYEISNRTIKLLSYFLFNLLSLICLSFAILKNFNSIILLLFAWSLSPLILNASLIFKQLRKITEQKNLNFKGSISSHLISSISVGLGTLFFRLIISKYFDDIKASQIITAISIGAILASLFSGPVGIKIIEKIKVQTIQKLLLIALVIFLLVLIFFRALYVDSFFYKTLLYSTLGSIIMMFSIIKKNIILFNKQLTARKDLWAAFLLNVTTLIICTKFNSKDEITASLFLISALINFLVYF
jgi:hypothetical protein